MLACAAAPPDQPAEPPHIPAGAIQLGSLAELEAAHLSRDATFALTVTEKELNQRIGQALGRRPGLPIESATARLGDGEAELSGALRVRGIELAPAVVLGLSAEGGQLVPDVRRVRIGGAELPSVVTRAMSGVVARQLDQRGLVDRYRIEALHIRPGAVTIVATAR
jgi:hypothetical protein